MGHEVTHARVNQGTTRDRGTEDLNEEYAKVMGSYSADGMEFSSSTYTNIELKRDTTTNTHTGNDTSTVIRDNTDGFVETVKQDGDNVDFDAYWTLSDVDRMDILGNPESPIENKINALVAAGLSPDEIKVSLGNNADFKALIKDNDEKFDVIYAQQKDKVDRVNSSIDNTVSTLEVLSTATMAATGTVPLAEKILKKEVSITVAGAIEAGAIDTAAQYSWQVAQQAYDEDFDMSQVDYTDFTLDTTSLGISMGTGFVLLPVVKNTANSIIDSTMATINYNKQISNANTVNRINKLKDRKAVHENYIGTVISIETVSQVVPSAVDTSTNVIVNSIEGQANAE